MTAQEIEWAKLTVGCRQCNDKDDYYQNITIDEGTGLYNAVCFNISTQNNTENDICGNGQIKVLEGLIATKMKLVCKECSEIIPNCMACSVKTDCIMCKPGYLRS